MKGTYLLILCLPADIAGLRVGRLGQFNFAAGYYLYVGSAFGPGGLDARLSYHARRHKQHPHWHVDYLRAQARLMESWAIGCDTPLERPLVYALAQAPELSVPAPGFGASDSTCPSHLLYCVRRPSPRTLTTAILAGAESLGAYGRQLTIEIHSYDDS